jgi:hypothetical protein
VNIHTMPVCHFAAPRSSGDFPAFTLVYIWFTAGLRTGFSATSSNAAMAAAGAPEFRLAAMATEPGMLSDGREGQKRGPDSSPFHAVEYFWPVLRHLYPNAPGAFALDSRGDTK